MGQFHGRAESALVWMLLGAVSGCGGYAPQSEEDVQGAAAALLTDATPPPLSGALTATVEGCDRVLLTWPDVRWPETPEADESGLHFYRVYRDGALIEETRAPSIREFSPERSYLMSGLIAGQSYAFSVTAVDWAGNESAPLAASATLPTSISVYCSDTAAPNTPVLTRFDPSDNGSRACGRLVKLSMTTTDNGSLWGIGFGSWLRATSGIAYYEVYRNGLSVGRSAGNYQQYLGQYPGHDYRYQVRAVDKAGNRSGLSNTIVHSVPADCASSRPVPQPVRLLVLPVRPSDGPIDPFPASDVYDFVRGGPSFPAALSARSYIQETSYGRINLSVTAASPNWITLPEPTMVSGSLGYCTIPAAGGWGYSCDHGKMLTQALAATGHNASNYDFFLFVKNGMTDQSSSSSYSTVHVMGGVRGAYTVALHELSHILGGSVEHSGGTWFCPGRSAGDGFANLTGLDIYDPHFGCNAFDPQGDPYSVLGHSGSTYHIPMLDKWLKGYLEPSQTVAAPDGTSEFVLQSAESSAVGYPVRHVIVPYNRCATLASDSPMLSVEYRTLTGFDADPLGYASKPPVEGVQIRLAPQKGVYRGAAESVYLGTVQLGGPTVFNYQGRSIELLEANGTTARIRVRRPDCWVVDPIRVPIRVLEP